MNTKTKNLEVTNFYHPKADTLLNKRIPQIQKEVKQYAIDLARQGRPKQDDPSMLFVPKITGLFEALLETLLRLIGAFTVLNEDGTYLQQAYENEELQLEKRKSELLQDQRLHQKETEGLKDVSALINRWRYKWRPVLIALSIGETAINYKILLLMTPNQITAIIASVGLCISLFIIAHSFKDILAYFQSKQMKWFIGVGIVLGVLLLLLSFNQLRISFMEMESGSFSTISKYDFVGINFVIWFSGALIALLYKVPKSIIVKHNEFQEVKGKLTDVNKELKSISERLEVMPSELNQKLIDIQNLRFMAKHYENSIVSEYHSCVALFTSENLFRRKDGVSSPKAFLETPPKLKTYFDNLNDKSNEL